MCVCVVGVLCEGDRYLDGGVFAVRLRRVVGVRCCELRLSATQRALQTQEATAGRAASKSRE